MSKKAGRPTKYTDELASLICERLMAGESLRHITADDKMPCEKTVYNWLASEDGGGFLQRYMRAREVQAERMAEDILAIADDGINDTYETEDGREIVNHDHIARSRLRVDTRKWLMSKMLPKKYGDKIDHDHNHTGEFKVTVQRFSDRPIAPE